MNTREILILQALKRKQLATQGHNIPADMVDRLLEQNPEAREEGTRNICAHIPKELFKEVEAMCDLLDLNKREIITMALWDFLAQAHATLQEFGVIEAFDAAGEHA